MTVTILLLLVGSFSLTALLTKLLHRHLSVMDVPNERSMHETPVPRGGGLAIMSVILAGITYYVPNSYLIAPVAILMLVSWLDDKYKLSAALRLLAHLTAAFLGCLALGDSFMLFDGLLPFWADRLIMVICWAWIINLYNFMDGIDGITATQTMAIAIGVGLFVSFLHLPLPYGIEIATIAFGACGGFLLYNWHPAKIFMGDVGSVPLGFLVGFFMFKLVSMGYPLPALLIPLYYLTDSGITITRRALRGEKIWKPHREHFYQRATTSIGNPKPVVFSIMTANLCLVAAAGLSVSKPWIGLCLGVIVTLSLLLRLSFAAHQK